MQLHPASVHFPIVSLILAGIAYIMARSKSDSHLDKYGFWLHIFGVASILLAILTGRQSIPISEIPSDAEAWLNWHEILGYSTLAWFGILLGWRYVKPSGLKPNAAALFIIFYALGLILMVIGAWLGGKMVYEAGIGVNFK